MLEMHTGFQDIESSLLDISLLNRNGIQPSASRGTRLLIIIPLASSIRAFLNELINEISAGGIEVHCACNGEVPELARGSAKVVFHDISIPRGMNLSGHLRAARDLRRIVANVQPNLIHVHFSAAIFSVAMARQTDWPILLGTFHGLAFPLIRGWKRLLISVVERWAARRYDRIWVLTEDDNALISSTLPAGRSGVVSPFGVGCDLEQFDRSKFDLPKITTIRTELRLKTSAFAFVFVGRFVDFKGFGDVVRTFLSVADRCPEAVLLLAGAFDPTHPSGLSDAELEQMKRSDRVLDLGFRNDVDRLLAASDVMVFPSEREGVPVCLMEALAMGCPVITKNARGCRDVVRNGVDGIVVRGGDTGGLAQAMIFAYSNREKIAGMAEQAKSGRERFDRRIFVSKQIEEYEKLLESKV